MPRISSGHQIERGHESLSGRKVVPPRPITVAFAANRVSAALVFGLLVGLAAAGASRVLFGSWEWGTVFFVALPVALAYLVLVKEPEDPERTFANRTLDLLVRVMLADLPLPVENITSPILVGLLVASAIPFFLWQTQSLVLVEPGGACYEVRDLACTYARQAVDRTFGLEFVRWLVPGIIAGALHRSVLREIIYHWSGLATKDDRGAPGPLMFLMGRAGSFLKVLGYRGTWFSRHDPRGLNFVFGMYVVAVAVVLGLLSGLVIWTYLTASLPDLKFWVNL